EIVKPRPVVLVRSALRGHDNAGKAAVLRAVRIREHADLRHGVEARRRVADRAEDGVRRRLAVLDVRHAIRLAAEELDVVAAPDNVGIEEQERLDVAAVSRKIMKLLLIEAASDGR